VSISLRMGMVNMPNVEQSEDVARPWGSYRPAPRKRLLAACGAEHSPAAYHVTSL
jgi:hypothetical protein